jgi:hypothetical protein
MPATKNVNNSEKDFVGVNNKFWEYVFDVVK